MTNNIRTFLLGLRNRHFLMLDFLTLIVTPCVALLLRADSAEQAFTYLRAISIYTLLTLAWKPLVLYLSGVYEQYWAFASTDSLLVLLGGGSIACVAEVAIYFYIILPSHWISPALPRSLPLMSGAVSMALFSLTRLSVRLGYERSLVGLKRGRTPVLIIGAGTAGSMAARELRTHPGLPYEPVGFLDDDPQKLGLNIQGIPVLGSLAQMPSIVRSCHIQEVIFAIPTASGTVIRGIDRECKRVGVKSKTIPGLFDLLNGTAKVSQIRDIQIEDLLRRGVFKMELSDVARLLAGTRVLVTGSGGSIGSELCRQIVACVPSDLILLGHGETSIFTIAAELRKHPVVEEGRTRLHTTIADIRDADRMDHIMQRYQPQAVFHAAAHKHVGLMEENLQDAVSNNVLGTRTVLDLAAKHGVRHCVMISSDKAVNPSSIMGVTKRIAELIVQETALRVNRPYVSVRFGNVLGSRGSVVPIFQAQIAAGGPVLVTHPEATRFFMTIPEAVQLVLQSAALGAGGEVFVLDMGQPIKIVDLAADMIRLNGLKEGTDIEVRYTGLTWGEKLHEQLFYEFEQPEPSGHERILVCRNHLQRSLERLLSGAGIDSAPAAIPLEGQLLRREVERLVALSTAGNEEESVNCIARIVPQYVGSEKPWLRRAVGSPLVGPAPGSE